MSTYLSMHRITSTVLEPVEHVPKGTTPEHWLRRLTLTDDEGAVLELTMFSQTADGLLTEADRVQAAARQRVEQYAPISQARLNGVREACGQPVKKTCPECGKNHFSWQGCTEASCLDLDAEAAALRDLERDNDGVRLQVEYGRES